jgi:PAS domain S-box-containing protein
MLFKTGLRQKEILENRIKVLEERLTIATDCLQKISHGNLDVQLLQGNKQEDQEGKDFVSMLEKMQSKMREYSALEKERSWVSEGLTKFMGLTRDDGDKRDFYDKVLTYLVRYTGVNQGGIFLLQGDNPENKFLELVACYAYGKKKFLEKRVALGEGLLGQCALEKETSRYTDIPGSYVKITSGLGEATPRFLLFVPLKQNDEVAGVIELASFQALEPHKIEFIEKVAETIASISLNMKNSRKVEQLLEESKQKADILLEQEENLKQNLEELLTAQEEMQRNQKELDQQTSLLKIILDNIPFPVFVKDEESKYTVVNKAEAKLFNLSEEELIGKDDSLFVSKEEEWKVIQQSDHDVMKSNVPVELPLQYFTTHQGHTHVFKTTKVPFINNVTGKKNILGVSIDLTEKLQMERKLLQEKALQGNNMLINIVGRQRMLSQKIGFYAEAVVRRGRIRDSARLQGAIDLYEHSLFIIRHGGMPKGVDCENPLPKADAELSSQIEQVEEVWSSFRKAAQQILIMNEAGSSDWHDKVNDMDECLNFIEENGELLLTLNNELMNICVNVNRMKAIEMN